MNFETRYLIQKLNFNLQENTLYKDAAEKAALESDKKKIADAFVYNFLGMIGLINAASDTQKAVLNRHFKDDKKVKIADIADTNNDMSLVVKLANDAGFFKNMDVVNKITRFLAKLKLGQVDVVDSSLVADWLDDMTMNFYSSISDKRTRRDVYAFKDDGGKTIDISRLAVKLKRRANKSDVSGEFRAIAKTFSKIKERDISASPAPATQQAPIGQPAAPTVEPKKKKARRSKAEMETYRNLIASGMSRKAARAAAEAQHRGTAASPTSVSSDGTSVTDTQPPVTQVTEINPRIPLSIGLDFLLSFISANEDRQIKRLQSKYDLSKEQADYVREKFQAFKDDILELLDFNAFDIKISIDGAFSIINSSNIFNQDIEVDTFFKEATFTSGFDRISKNTGLIRYLYQYPANASLKDYVRLGLKPGDIMEMITVISGSGLSSKKSMIDYVVKGATYSNVMNTYLWGDTNDKDSDIGRAISLFGYKMEIQNDTFVSVIENLLNSGYSSYNAKRLIKMLLAGDNFGNWSFMGINPGKTIMSKMSSMIGANINDEIMHNFILDSFNGNYSDIKNSDHILFKIIRQKYEDDIIDEGPENSEISKHLSNGALGHFIKLMGYALEDFTAMHPSDKKILQIRFETKGLETLTKEEIVDYVEYNIYERNVKFGYIDKDTTLEEFKKTPNFQVVVMQQHKELFRRTRSAGAADKVGEAITLQIDRDPSAYDRPIVFKSMMQLIPEMEKDTTVELMRIAKKHGIKNFFDPSIYTSTGKRDEKEEFRSLVSGVMYDCIGTDVEDYFTDLLEQMPSGVISHIRKSLVGMNAVVKEVEDGKIKTFESIGDKRLKEILAMNDINFSSIVSGKVSRKKKGEKWLDYFKRAQKELESSSGKFLPEEQVDLVDGANVKAISKTYNGNYHAGKHGNIYAKVLKAYDGKLKFPEFDEFRKNNPGDGEITPAFHGTGGIAASMILRYGFKVIKSTDSSVVGRMLGDGIYFSNKLDKTLQYVSNKGYGRSYGEKGYIFEMDNNLGKKDPTNRNGPDYRVMGLGGDRIRSPEWCVRDPKAQLSIKKVYEVELVPRSELDSYTINESEQSDEFMSFKKFMKENVQLKGKNRVASFTFRDGQIPIFDEKGIETFVDFEDAIKDKLIPSDLIDYSRQGPVVVFENADTQESYDIRFADVMNGQAFESYKNNFMRVVHSKD